MSNDLTVETNETKRMNMFRKINKSGKKFHNLNESLNLVYSYPQYLQVFLYPTGEREKLDIEDGIIKHITNDTTNLNYVVKIDVNHHLQLLECSIIPIVESA